MNMTIKQHADHWINASSESIKDMDASLRSKRRMLALFSGHQAIEKILKALLAAQDKQIPHIHKLTILASQCGLRLDAAQQAELAEITGFYIATKYTSVKSQFQQICTPQYVNTWAKIVRNWRRTLKQQTLLARSEAKDKAPAAHPENTFL